MESHVTSISNMKAVTITAYTIEFPKNAGWTMDILKPYVIKGGFLDKGSYFIPEMFSKINYEKMLEDGQIGKLFDREKFGDLHLLTSLEVLKRRGWYHD